MQNPQQMPTVGQAAMKVYAADQYVGMLIGPRKSVSTEVKIWPNTLLMRCVFCGLNLLNFRWPSRSNVRQDIPNLLIRNDRHKSRHSAFEI